MTTDEVLAGAPLVGPKGFDSTWDDLEHEVNGFAIGPRHYDREGRPISMRTWVRLIEFGGHEYQHVAHDTIGPYDVSTVWLGLNHNYYEGAPHIFETMVFDRSKPDLAPMGEPQPEVTNWTDLECRRYATEAEALEGHAALANEVRLLYDALGNQIGKEER